MLPDAPVSAADRLALLSMHLAGVQTHVGVALRETARPDAALPVIESFVDAAAGELQAVRTLLASGDRS